MNGEKFKFLVPLILMVMVMGSMLSGFTGVSQTYGNTEAHIATELKAAGEKAEAYIIKAVPAPQTGAIGGEWTIVGLIRGNGQVPLNYYEDYYRNLADYVKEKGGILHNRKYTEYSRVVLALSAMGKNPENVEGYDLLGPLKDFDQVVWQGINGASWALMALDSLSSSDEAYKSRLIDNILEKEIEGGGFALSGDTPDPDTTAMVLQALSPHTDNEAVLSAIERALEVMSKAQSGTGGFSYMGVETSESTSQMIVALCSLGINPHTDVRFIKNGVSLLDNLLSYQMEDGSFCHEKDKGTNLMASEQCLNALTAVSRLNQRQSPLYDITGSRKPGVGVTVDGATMIFNTSMGVPFIDEASRVQVPMRAVMENYGAEVDWDSKEKTATVKMNGIIVTVPIDESTITVKNEKGEIRKTAIDTKAQILDGRTYLPIRAIIVALGGEVDWDSGSKTVIIEK